MADEEGGQVSDAQLMSEINACASEVDKLLAKNDKGGALRIALQNPPITTKTIEVKVIYKIEFINIF